MNVADFCVVMSSKCCGGHPAGSIVSIAKVYGPEETSEGITVYACAPVKHCTSEAVMFHCDACLTPIDQENI